MTRFENNDNQDRPRMKRAHRYPLSSIGTFIRWRRFSEGSLVCECTPRMMKTWERPLPAGLAFSSYEHARCVRSQAFPEELVMQRQLRPETTKISPLMNTD